MLELKNITKQYKHSAKDYPAVNQVSLKVANGEFLTIIGPSGSGKSTLLSIIAGLQKPSAGTVEFEGDSKIEQRKKHHRSIPDISFIMQGQNLLSNLTVEENLYLPFYLAGRKSNYEDRAKKVLMQVGLSEVMYSYPGSLSGGELRRVAIARALMGDSRLLIADEPTSNLDSENAVIVMDLLHRINEGGKTVLISTHDERFIPSSTSIYKMDKGVLTTIRLSEGIGDFIGA